MPFVSGSRCYAKKLLSPRGPPSNSEQVCQVTPQQQGQLSGASDFAQPIRTRPGPWTCAYVPEFTPICKQSATRLQWVLLRVQWKHPEQCQARLYRCPSSFPLGRPISNSNYTVIGRMPASPLPSILFADNSEVYKKEKETQVTTLRECKWWGWFSWTWQSRWT